MFLLSTLPVAGAAFAAGPKGSHAATKAPMKTHVVEVQSLLVAVALAESPPRVVGGPPPIDVVHERPPRSRTGKITTLLAGFPRDGGILRVSADGRWLYMLDSRDEGDLWTAHPNR
jgi:hypothetical protein